MIVIEECTNEDRAQNVVSALSAYADGPGGDPIYGSWETIVADFLTDLRHLCDAREIDFQEMASLSYRRYIQDKQEKNAQPTNACNYALGYFRGDANGKDRLRGLKSAD